MGLYLSEGMRLKSFSSSTRGTRAVIKVELETEDLYEMGFFLRCLADLEARQAAEAVARKSVRGRRAPRLALPAPGAESSS